MSAGSRANHVNRERRVPVTFRGYRFRSGDDERQGLRATPIVRWKRGSVDVAADDAALLAELPEGD